MNQQIQDAIEKVRENDFVSYFEILEPIVPSSKRAMFSQLRNRFNSDRFSSHFDQQLIVFAREVGRLVGDTSPQPQKTNNEVANTGKIDVDKKKLKMLLGQAPLGVVLDQLMEILDTPNTQLLLNHIIVIKSTLNGLNPLTMPQNDISIKQAQLASEVLSIIDGINE